MKRDNKKTCQPIAVKFLSALMLIFIFSPVGFGQITQADESSAVKVPEQLMKQIVQRILAWSFKPRKNRAVIYLSNQGIKQAWLPKIKNIEFRLLTDEEYKQRDKWSYFFTETKFSDGKYEIGFGLGDFQCNSTGDSWNFRLSKQKVKLWQNGHFGSGCGSSSSGLD